jgi:hypothetical protein
VRFRLRNLVRSGFAPETPCRRTRSDRMLGSMIGSVLARIRSKIPRMLQSVAGNIAGWSHSAHIVGSTGRPNVEITGKLPR